MKQYNVSLVIEVEEDCTLEEVQRFVEFQTGYRGDMPLSNPLCDAEMKANYVEVDEH